MQIRRGSVTLVYMEKFSKTLSGLFEFFLDIAKIVIVSLIIIIPIRYFIAQPFFVKGASMEPTYQQGDYLIVDELSYKFHEPQRGDVIIFKFPEDTSQFFIKRIIGLPGEMLAIKDTNVVIKNKEYPEGFLLEEAYIFDATKDVLEIRLDDNEYFVMGDNRGASHDSRRWGPLNKTFVLGKVFVRAWPFNKFEIIEKQIYN